MDHQTITAERGRRAADLRAAAVAVLEQQSIAAGVLLDLDDETCVAAGRRDDILRLIGTLNAGDKLFICAPAQAAAPSDLQPLKALADADYQEIVEPVLSREGMRRYRNADPLTLDPSDLRAMIDRAQLLRQQAAPAAIPEGWPTNEQITDALHACGIDTRPSKFGFDALQIDGTSVPGLRNVFLKLLAAAPAHPAPIEAQGLAKQLGYPAIAPAHPAMPPLPDPIAIVDRSVFPEGAFGADQMRAYARAAVSAATLPALLDKPQAEPTTEILRAMVHAADKRDVAMDKEDARAVFEAAQIVAQPSTVTLSGHQLHMALDLINPDGPRDADQLDDELTFGIVQHKDDDGKVSVGMCCWNGDTDGVLPLDGEYSTPAGEVSQGAAPTADAEQAPAPIPQDGAPCINCNCADGENCPAAQPNIQEAGK